LFLTCNRGKLVIWIAFIINFLNKLLAPNVANADQPPSVEVQQVVTSVSPTQSSNQVEAPVETPQIIQTPPKPQIPTLAVAKPSTNEQKPKEVKNVQQTEEKKERPKRHEREPTITEKIELETPRGAIGERLTKVNKATERTVLTLERKRPKPKRTCITQSQLFNHEDLDKIEQETKAISALDVPTGDFEKLERRSHAELWRKQIDPNDFENGQKVPPPPTNAPPAPPTSGPPPPPSGAPPKVRGGGPMGVSLSAILGARTGLRKTGEELK
jgi:hypothetical protein